MARVQLQGLGKTYPNGVRGLRAVDLDVEDGELLAVVGPSGSGKSTLARLVAGLEEVSEGQILFDGRSVNELAARDRDVAMVFQHPALYPHLNVAENLAFGCKARGLPKQEVVRRVAETSDLLGLSNILNRRPATLSGGQRQRVAIGRAIARRPRVLLLDEPFTALDAPLRLAIRADLVELQRALKLTTVLVTHDQSEALAVGDRLAVFGDGSLHQVGTPFGVYSRPASRFVAQFLGYPPINILNVTIEEDGDLKWVRFAGERVRLPAGQTLPPGSREVGLRAEHIQPKAPGDSRLTGNIRRIEPLGHEVLASIQIADILVTIRLVADEGIVVGDRIGLEFDFSHAVWFS